MADKKISELTAASTPLAGSEVLPIVQSGSTVKVSAANVTAGRAVSALTYTSTATTGTAPLVVASTTEVVNLRAANATSADTANAVKSNATTGVLQVTGPGAATTRVMTTPDANFTAARTDASQTFTGNQTFSADVISSNGKLVVSPNGQTVGMQLDSFVSGGNFDNYICNNSNVAGTLATLGFGRMPSLLFGYVRSNNNSQALELGTIDQFSQIRTNRFVISATGDATINTGNLVIGTSGKGIDFSATPGTGTSELFSDYEEGTWTPNVGGTATYTIQKGSYIKVGRLVTVSFDMQINAIGTGDTAGMLGLPFTVGNVNSGRFEQGNGAAGYFQDLAVNVYSITFNAAANGTTVYSISNSALGATANVNPAIYGNSARVQGTVTYIAAA